MQGEHATIYSTFIVSGLRLLNDVFVSHVSQTRDYKRGVNGSMLSSRLLNDVFVSRVSQTRDYKRGVIGNMLSSRLLKDMYVSRVGTRTHHLKAARRACHHLDHVYIL
jgi:hypothetical protein